MISNERLQELINEGATIYTIDKTVNYPIPLFLDEHYVILAKEDGAEECLAYTHERVIEGKGELLINLYETQEQAEWHLKYHATRTDELDLPMWEGYYDTKDTIFWCEMGVKVCLRIRPSFIDVRLNNKKVVFNGEATEENYIKACDLCIKLFKGEEK